jgi:AmmeMemoRadiSam system protein B
MLSNELIPQLRYDLQCSSYEEDGREYVVLSDKFGYANSDIVISIEFYEILISLSISTRYCDLPEIMGIDNEPILNIIIENIKFLDESGLLESESFRLKRAQIAHEYLSLTERPYICSESSYPENEDELNLFLENLFLSSDINTYRSAAKALVIPHIDLRLSYESHSVYSAAYHSAFDTDFDVLIILGTAHYYSSDIFMLTHKNYSTPLGNSQTDFELLKLWNEESGGILHYNEFAHKPEHSIEYQILLSQYYFKNKNYTVLPILVGSFHDFVLKKQLPETDERFTILINSLKSAIKKSGKKPLFISSVDFAHIGRKFDDDFDASPLLNQLKFEDKELIDSVVAVDKNRFFKKIIDDCDKFKICGTAPIYSMLCLDSFEKGHFLKYSQWNEIEAKSAVSFASIAMY